MALQLITTNNKDLGFSRYHSNLKSDFASGVSSFDVYSISQFAINKVLLVGEWGNEGTSIILTHSVTAPSGNTISLASALTKAYPKDTPVSIIPFDQVEFSHAATLTGSKTVLDTLAIDPEQETMTYEDTTNTDGYYFTRYKNSISGLFSDYSDGIPYSGLPQNTVGYAIDTAMNELHQGFTEKLTFPMVIGFAKQMLKLVRGKLRTWNRYTEYDQNFGTISGGVRRYAMPTDAYDQFSNKSIKSLRIGDGEPLLPIDRNEYIKLTEDVSYTEVATNAAIGATSLVLDDTSDLDDDGEIYVYKSGTRYDLDYTANDKTTNTLTLAADQITVELPAGSQVWQGLTEDTPEHFTVMDGYIYIFPMPESEDEGKNLTGDYLTDIESIDSQMDVITGVKYDMLIPFLKYKIRAVVENNGMENLQDPSYQEFRELLTDAIKNEPLPENAGFRPRTRIIRGANNSQR